MPVPVVYSKSQEGAIASYNYTDIAEGTGVVVFQGFQTQISGANALHIADTNIYSAGNSDSSGTSWTFNTSAFNAPRTMKGTAYVRYSTNYTGASSEICDQKVSINHVDADNNVTELASAELPRITSAGSGILNNFVAPLTIPKTNFKKGESIRIIVTAVVSGGTTYIGHDPANRNGALVTPAATYPTKFEAYIPFDLDL